MESVFSEIVGFAGVQDIPGVQVTEGEGEHRVLISPRPKPPPEAKKVEKKVERKVEKKEVKVEIKKGDKRYIVPVSKGLYTWCFYNYFSCTNLKV